MASLHPEVNVSELGVLPFSGPSTLVVLPLFFVFRSPEPSEAGVPSGLNVDEFSFFHVDGRVFR